MIEKGRTPTDSPSELEKKIGYTYKQIAIAFVVLIITQCIIGFIAYEAAVGAGISNTDYQINKILQNEKKQVAKMFLADIEYEEKNFEGILDATFDVNNPDYMTCVNIIQPIYPEWGFWHSNRQDISKFDINLQNKLISFYQVVLTAEDARNVYNNFDINYPVDPNDSKVVQNRLITKHSVCNSIFNSIVAAKNKTPELKKELSIIANS